jgi:predicted DsbA family dithiol-disulfide isomerase
LTKALPVPLVRSRIGTLTAQREPLFHDQSALLAAALDLVGKAEIGVGSQILSTLSPASFADLVTSPVASLLSGAPLTLFGPFEAAGFLAVLDDIGAKHCVFPAGILPDFDRAGLLHDNFLASAIAVTRDEAPLRVRQRLSDDRSARTRRVQHRRSAQNTGEPGSSPYIRGRARTGATAAASRTELEMTLAAEEKTEPVTIDIVSDVVCPWCYIGKRNLEAALATIPKSNVEIRWRPYQLDSTIPPEGIARRVYLEGKFGARVDEIYTRVATAGREAGLDFAFNRIERSPNTLNAHRLIRWSQSVGKQNDIVERLFRSFFIDGRDVGDRAVLIETAAEAGMEPDVVARLLEDEADKDAVREEIATAQRLGVTGVPFFIFAGRYGLPGAQPADALVNAINKAAGKSGESVGY